MAIVAEGHRQRTYLPPDSAHEVAADVDRPEDVPETELFDWPGRINVYRYGMTHHADLFTNRQLTALTTFSDLVTEAHARILADSDGDTAYADAVATYLALGVSRLTDLQNSLARWENTRMQVRNLFGRQAIPMVWDFAEPGLFSRAAGDYEVSLASIANAIPRIGESPSTTVVQADAADRAFANLVVCTDPPYYDNIGYADLSDFFYVWLRRSLRSIYPDLLGTMLTPKDAELVATRYRFGDKADEHFERGFSAVFSRAAVESRPDIPLTVFYAFKQSESDDNVSHGDSAAIASTGWEKMLAGMVQSGLAIVGTWPMRTELANRMLGAGTNALASSIVLVCRRRLTTAGVTDRRGFQQLLKSRLGHDLPILQSGGIAPVDLAQAAIGPGMAVFSSYAKVIESDGSPMTVRKALQLINQVLDEVTAEQEGEFDEDTRWAIAWYSEFGMDEGPYGRADDLSRAKNVSVEGLVRAGIVRSGAGKVRLLERSELGSAWDPATDPRLTVWEVTQHLIRRLLEDGEASAGELLGRVGGLGDAARDLAYRLFQVAESKRWAKEAGPYNDLAASWPRLSEVAASGPPAQQSLI